MTHQDRLDALRGELDRLMAGRKDWLAAVTVRCPRDTPADRWSREVGAILEDLRLDGVAVDHIPGEGPPWVAATRFTEGWAP